MGKKPFGNYRYSPGNFFASMRRRGEGDLRDVRDLRDVSDFSDVSDMPQKVRSTKIAFQLEEGTTKSRNPVLP